MKYMIYCLITIFLLSSCSPRESRSFLSFHASDYVLLGEYGKTEYINSDLLLSSGEIENIILLELSYHSCYDNVENSEPFQEEQIALIDIISEEGVICSKTYYFAGIAGEQNPLDAYLLGRSAGEPAAIVTDSPLPEYNIPAGTPITIIINDILEFANMDDEAIILSFYGCETMSEVFAFIQNRSTNESIFYEIYNHIYENRAVTFGNATSPRA